MPYADPEKNKQCKAEYQRNNWDKHLESSRQWYSRNKEKHKKVAIAYQKKYRIYLNQIRKNRRRKGDNHRTEWLKYTYKHTPEKYNDMLNLQDGKCAICNNPPETGEILYIDHDHSCCNKNKSCGKCIRGLLCSKCNSFLGVIENWGWFLRAIKYLDKYMGINEILRRIAIAKQSGNVNLVSQLYDDLKNGIVDNALERQKQPIDNKTQWQETIKQ